jgi:hypothetical protein
MTASLRRGRFHFDLHKNRGIYRADSSCFVGEMQEYPGFSGVGFAHFMVRCQDKRLNK